MVPWTIRCGSALFRYPRALPDCHEASDLVYELFCDEWTIYDMRVALQQNIDEWDDRPWQQRRRLALSYRFMSRWDGKHQEDMLDRGDPPDVQKILHDGKMELLGAYCLGNEECTDYAWTIFAEALKKAKDGYIEDGCNRDLEGLPCAGIGFEAIGIFFG